MHVDIHIRIRIQIHIHIHTHIHIHIHIHTYITRRMSVKADNTNNDVLRDDRSLEEVEENEDEAPNPFDQIGLILQLLFMYAIQGATLKMPRVIATHMAHEVDQCEDMYYVQTFLDNVWWPFSLKILFAPLIDLIPLRCFKQKYHRRAYICVTGIISAGMFLSLAFSWIVIDPDETCPRPLLLFLHLLLIVLATAVGDVALDGLSVLSLQGKNIGYFALIQSVGDTVGSTGGGNAFLMAERKIGVKACFIVFAILILIALFCATRLKEATAKKNVSTTPVLDAYKELYAVITNRNALYFGLAVMALWRASRPGFSSQVDLKNIGYTKDDIIIVSLIEAVPTIVAMLLITQYISARGNQIKKLKIFYPMFIFGQALFFATLAIPPYVNAVTNGDDKESWVFPFRTITNLIAIPFHKVCGLLMTGFAAKIAPTSCPGTFMTLMMTLTNLGPRLFTSLTNPMRNLLTNLAEASGNGICDGSIDNLYQGRLKVCINTAQFEETGTTKYENCDPANTTLRRFCGKETCEPDQYCNKLGDGYVLFGIICLILSVLYYVLFICVIARKVDKEKIDYDPSNVNERIAWCPKTCCGVNMDADDADLTEVDDENHHKISYVELA
jgi:hypothetical protein